MTTSSDVWYVAAGYKLPAGIEAYLLHYATELRNQGFNPRIIVFEPLPKVPHRFLVSLHERGIPIESLYEKVACTAKVLTWVSYVPWRIRQWRRPQKVDHRPQTIDQREENTFEQKHTKSAKGECLNASGENAQPMGFEIYPAGAASPPQSPLRSSRASVQNIDLRLTSYTSLLTYWRKRLAVRELKKMIERGKPAVIHVKGRLIMEAWPVFPSDRTLYQHALMGTRDPSWADNEAEAFSVFLNRIAKVLVQGKGIAETFAKSFNISRPLDVVYTMAPDEFAPEAREIADNRQQPADRKENTFEQKRAKSAKGGNVFAAEGGEEKIPSRTLRASVQNSEFSQTDGGDLRFGILCRLTEQKGIAYILEALKMYKERHGTVNFTFAGQGPMEDEIREAVDSGQWTVGGKTAKEKIIEQKIAKGAKEENGASTGGGEETIPSRALRTSVQNSYLKPREVRIVPVSTAVDILRELDVFVHPGLDDAMPVSIVEALMCGVPCIVSDVGASPELVRDGVEGFVIKAASSEAIFAAMERFAMMTGPELRLFKQRARQRYEEVCRPEVVGKQVAGIYEEVTAVGRIQ